MKNLQLNPVFVKTKNVRNFEVMMDALELGAGEGRLGMVFGRAGRGKTRTSQWYAANNDCIYLRVATVWATSQLDFLRALCRELEVLNPPKRKGPCFQEVVDRLVADPRPVFVDEIEKLPGAFLDLIRDLSDISCTPFVLVGEEELVAHMKKNRRVWSRAYQQLEFEPISVADIIVYGQQAAGLRLDIPVAGILHSATDGDFRLVRRNMLSLVQMANAKGPDGPITPDMAKLAVKTGLTGK